MAQSNSFRLKRRLRTYSGRGVSSLRGGIKHPVFFMHLPKCGGTSIAEALYATVPIQQRVGVVDAISTRRAMAIYHDDVDALDRQHDDLENSKNIYDFREQLVINHMSWNTRMIHGHVLYSNRADRHFGDQYKYVTVLREPIERVISNFAHSVQSGMISDDFDTYLDGPIVRAHGLTFLRYFSGTAVLNAAQEEAALEKSIETLKKFAVIGFLDDLGRFASDYKQVLGIRPRIARYNQAQTRVAQISEAQVERLRQMFAHEIQFWEFSRGFANK
jgi:hypothetical protein